MEIVIDRGGWRQPQTGSHLGGDESRPDWHGLRARLCASYAARLALAGEQQDGAGIGSFDRETAKFIAAYGDDLSAVNLTVSGNRKPTAGIDELIASPTITGDRG